MFVDPQTLPQSSTDGPQDWAEAWSSLAAGADNSTRLVENMNSDLVTDSEIYADRIDFIEKMTGTRLDNPIETAPMARRPMYGTKLSFVPVQTPLDTSGTIAEFDRKVQSLAERYPDVRSILAEPVADEAARRRRQAEAASAKAAQSPELGTVGRFTAQLAGGLRGAARDPFQWQMAGFGAGPSAARTVAGRIGQTMLTEFLLNGGQTAILQAASQDRKAAAGLDHGLTDALKNVGIAGTFGALFGGTVQGGAELARLLKLGDAGAGPSARVIEGRPQPGDVEAMAAAAGMDLAPDTVAQLGRSFEERVMDDLMLPEASDADASILMRAALRHAEDPDNFPAPELVERALADSAGEGRTLSADDYERIYDGDEAAIDAYRAQSSSSLLVAEDIADTFPADPIAGRTIRPEEAAEPFDQAAMAKAEVLAGEILEPRRVGQFGPIFRPEEFDGDWKAAVEALRTGETGELIGMLSHPEIGPIDAFWGRYDPARKRQGRGLAKIAGKHPEVLEALPDRLPGMKIIERDDKKILLEDADRRAIVRLDYDGEAKTWLVTAYEKNRRAGKTPDRSGNLKEDGHSSSSTSAMESIADSDDVGNLADVADLSRPRGGEPESLFDLIAIEDGDGNVVLRSASEAMELADIPNFHAELLEACKL